VDDCGVWKHKGARRTSVVIDDSAGAMFHKREHSPDTVDVQPNIFIYLNQDVPLSVHPKSSPFDLKVAFVQFKFKGQEEHSIDNSPHKNSKS